MKKWEEMKDRRQFIPYIEDFDDFTKSIGKQINKIRAKFVRVYMATVKEDDIESRSCLLIRSLIISSPLWNRKRGIVKKGNDTAHFMQHVEDNERLQLWAGGQTVK